MTDSDHKKGTEEDLLERIFGGADGKGWKNRYPIIWCETCQTLAISCPDCDATSCNCQACEKCTHDIDEFHKTKHNVENYLSESERRVLRKADYLKKYIKDCLYAGFTEINWPYLRDNGKLSLDAVFLFEEVRSYREYAIHEYLSYANEDSLAKMKETVAKILKEYP